MPVTQLRAPEGEALRMLYGKTPAEQFIDAMSRFMQRHSATFKAYRRLPERDRWPAYDSLKRQWADSNADLAGEYYAKAALEIAGALNL